VKAVGSLQSARPYRTVRSGGQFKNLVIFAFPNYQSPPFFYLIFAKVYFLEIVHEIIFYCFFVFCFSL